MTDSTLKAQALRDNPDFPWLSAGDAASARRLLESLGIFTPHSRILSCDKAGQGNMNLTLRVRIQDGDGIRPVILKQSRPWVEKYDFIAAPWDRAISEMLFYQQIAALPDVASQMPRLLAADPATRTLALEDLGAASDLTSTYAGQRLPDITLRQLGRYLRSLHDGTRGSANPRLTNRAMRELNHQHMYVIPLQESNGLDLTSIDPALIPISQRLRGDAVYRQRVQETGERYLADGPALLHGDFFPGSWLQTDDGIRIIDPEFCFFGDPEFDLGICIAHLRLARLPWDQAERFLNGYDPASLNRQWLARYAACEVMRRLIGYAQLPLPTGQWKAELLEASRRALLELNVANLFQP